MQTAIVKAETKEQYYFFDDPVWDEDIRKDETIGVLCTEEAIGTHECVKSCLYDDKTGFMDQIQEEYGLPDGEKFIVTYFQQIPGDCSLWISVLQRTRSSQTWKHRSMWKGRDILP